MEKRKLGKSNLEALFLLVLSHFSSSLVTRRRIRVSVALMKENHLQRRTEANSIRAEPTVLGSFWVGSEFQAAQPALFHR